MASRTDAGDIVFTAKMDASGVEQGAQKVRDALNQVEQKADDTTTNLGSMKNEANKTKISLKNLSGEGISAVAAGLSTVNPQVGALVGLFGQLRVLSGPLAVILGGVTAAMMLNTQHQEDLDRRREISKNVADEMAKAEIRLRDAYEENLVALGELSEAELEVLSIRRQAFAENQPQVKALNAALAEQIRIVEKRKGDLEDLNENQRNFNQLQGLAVKGLQEEQQKLEGLQKERDAAIEKMRETVAFEIKKIELTERQTRASQEQAEAEREAAAAAKERATANQAAIAQLTADLNSVAAESGAIIDQTVAELDAALNEVEALALRDQEAIQGGISNSLGAVASLSSTLSDQLADDNKKTALALFRTSQAAGLSQVAVNTAVAITKALAELGPIAGPIAGVGLGLAGAAQAAIIASTPAPSAHIGTGMPGSRDPLAPDERMSRGRRVLTTEASGPGGVLNSMGTQLINDVNTGRVQSSGRITAVIGRSHLDQELFRSGRRGTSRYARSLRTNPHPKPQGGY